MYVASIGRRLTNIGKHIAALPLSRYKHPYTYQLRSKSRNSVRLYVSPTIGKTKELHKETDYTKNSRTCAQTTFRTCMRHHQTMWKYQRYVIPVCKTLQLLTTLHARRRTSYTDRQLHIDTDEGGPLLISRGENPKRSGKLPSSTSLHLLQ